MPLNDTIYIDENRIRFTHLDAISYEQFQNIDMLWRVRNDEMDWEKFLKMFEPPDLILSKPTSKRIRKRRVRSQNIILASADPEGLKRDFKRMFQRVDAAGGLVVNPLGEILFIVRHGKWDLPKGKVERGESKRAAAIREIFEETGLQTMALQHKIGSTYHTYKTSFRKRILKKSHWYYFTAPKQDVYPQANEGIQEALWVRPEQCALRDLGSYQNIQDVIEAGYPY